MTLISASELCFVCQLPTSRPKNPYLGAAVCQGCWTKRRSYSAANEQSAGTSDGLPLFSVEFEICVCGVSSPPKRRQARERALVLTKHGYLRTEDSSVDDEYKSPRFSSQEAFLCTLPALEGLKDLVDSCCGTHLHIDCPAYALVHEYRYSLFGQLREHLTSHEAETVAFWGRSSQTLINTYTRYRTIEFRLPHFRSAEQYLAVVQFCRAVGHYLDLHLNPQRTEALSLLPYHQIGTNILAFYQRMVAPTGADAEVAHAHTGVPTLRG